MKRAIPDAPYETESLDTLTRAAFEERLVSGEPLAAVVEDVAVVRIENHVPFVCTAIHDGHDLRRSLREQCLLAEEERRYEEDPFTGAIIRAMPVTVVAPDSRYEYDLNRPRSQCVYTEAWGKRVWKGKLRPHELGRSREKHLGFYRIFDILVSELERKFGACLVLDVHSYNHRRIEAEAPTFNLGTAQIDLPRWEPVIQRLEKKLARMTLPSIETPSSSPWRSPRSSWTRTPGSTSPCSSRS
jgi:N-formylglutamate amidohydrolase